MEIVNPMKADNSPKQEPKAPNDACITNETEKGGVDAYMASDRINLDVAKTDEKAPQ